MADKTLIKTKQQQSAMQDGGKIHAKIMDQLVAATQIGVTTEDLNILAEKLLQKFHVKGVFKGYHGYPKSICTSINEQIVHGIPSKKVIIHDGDLVKIDLGLYYQGLVLDGGRAVLVGNTSVEAKKLVLACEDALALAIVHMKDGVSVASVARHMQSLVEKRGYSVVRELTGHGVGASMHIPPEMPNFYRPKDEHVILREGMTIAVEPMINEGERTIEELHDGWTIVTRDRKLSAWCEHTVLVGKEHGIILTK